MVSFQKYPEYLATKYPWIGDVPSSWEVRRLKEVGRLFGGAGFPHEYQNVQGEELYFYKVGDLSLSENGKTLLASPHTISKDTAQLLRAIIVPKNAIVYAKIGAALLLNRRRMTTAACCIDNNMTAYVVDAEKVVPEWAFYWLSTLDFGEHVNPGAVPSFSEGYQSVLPIPVPPIEEQKVIARFLDFKTAQIDALIAKQQSLLGKLAEKRTALISHAVTKGLDPSVAMKDSEVPWLGDIPAHWAPKRMRFCMKTNPSKGEIKLNDDELVSFIPMEAVGEFGGLNLDAEKELGEIGGGYTYFADSDVVVAKITPCFENGKGAIARGLKNGIAFGTTELHVMRSDDTLLPDYLFHLTMSHPFRCIGESVMYGAGGQKRVPETFLKDFRIGLPPVNKQQDIIDYINKVNQKLDMQMSKAADVIDRLTEYRSALITNAVTGKIDVRGFAIPQTAAGVTS
ncbi:restriction endonuclease subunit S [Aeromonas dhakensis]|uniref:restriction endonuclease subunit S n=1 Tax=Aeromonas dhakensis TaxID=196024 RepID=UPI003F7ABE18